jgi:nucleoside-diphosphate-sugar epimerase
VTRRALVTGGTGFIGGQLARRIVADGWQVTLLVRSPERVPADLAGSCRVLPADPDGARFAAGVADAAPDVCFHLATHFTGVHTPADVDSMIATNVGLGTRLAEALSTRDDVAFVNVGTIWQHHGARPYGPSSLYAATKQAFVDVLRYYAECTPLRAVTVELSDTYGAGDPRTKLLQLLAQAHRTGRPLRLSPGEQLVSFVHVDDVLDALLAAVPLADSTAPSFSAFGCTMTVREFVALVGRALGSQVPVEWGAREYRPREMLQPWAVWPPVPGWAPRTDLLAGLRAVLAR